MANKGQKKEKAPKDKVGKNGKSGPDDNHDMEGLEEATHWKDVMRTFLHYEEFLSMDIRRRQEHLNRLPDKWIDRLPNETFSKLDGISHAAKCNQDFFTEMVRFQSKTSDRTESVLKSGHIPHKDDGAEISYSQQHRNQAVLHSLYREWSLEAKQEREDSLTPLINELIKCKPVTKDNAYIQKVLVPGCGLGRLPLEIIFSIIFSIVFSSSQQ